jgi:hypothetical protein
VIGRRWPRRTAAAAFLVGIAGAATGVTGMVTAHAAAAPGSGLGAISITTKASGVRAPFYSSGGEDVEAQVPWATVSMGTGGVTHALTSIFWPGDTGGHGGDTLALLGAPCLPPNPNGVIPAPVPCVYQPSPPPQSVYDSLNDPYKAEAQSGSGAPVATAGGQGVSMRAEAHDTDGLAQTTMSASSLPAAGDQFGTTSTVATVKATGPTTVVVDATSVLHNVSLGGGAITIDQVTSVAHAVTDTVHATGTAATTVAGMKIAGVPVTVDSSGIHVGPQGSSLPGTDQLNQALQQSGFQVYVAKPTKTVNGAAITLDSGSVVLMQTNGQYASNANDTTRVLVLGGAGIQAEAGKGFDFVPSVLGSLPPPSSGTAGTPGTPAVPGNAGSVTGGAAPAAAPIVASPQLAGHSMALPGGLSPALVVLTLLGAALAAAGLRRLSDSVLAVGGPACPLGEGH